MPHFTRAISLLLATFATVNDELNRETTGKAQATARDILGGRRCVVASLGIDPVKVSGSAPPCSVASALVSAISHAGCQQPKLITLDEAGEAENLMGCDVLFLCCQALGISQSKAKDVWRANVTATRNACEAAERAGVGRIVLLGSILSLGHSPDGAPVDASTPYLTDDNRTPLERSLFRQEMEVWQMAERGIGVSVVCGGIAYGASDWARHIDPAKHARLLTTPAALANALVCAASDEMTGKRLICTGMSDSLAKSLTWSKPSFIERLFCETAKAEKMLKRLGVYASDFPAAEE